MVKGTRKILCFTGWGQRFDSLKVVFDDERFAHFEVVCVDYSKFAGFDEFVADFKGQKDYLDIDVVIGWSLGGQIALKLIEMGLLGPEKLVLIAPPFQMVKDERIKAAMGQDTFKEFYENFAKSPDATLKKFSILMSMNDKHSKEIAKNLDISDENHENLVIWLDELKKTSFFDFDFSKTPKTLFFHGKGDMIVHILQMSYFKKKIQDFTGHQYENCGHAPHLSDIERFRGDLLEFI